MYPLSAKHCAKRVQPTGERRNSVHISMCERLRRNLHNRRLTRQASDSKVRGASSGHQWLPDTRSSQKKLSRVQRRVGNVWNFSTAFVDTLKAVGFCLCMTTGTSTTCQCTPHAEEPEPNDAKERQHRGEQGARHLVHRPHQTSSGVLAGTHKGVKGCQAPDPVSPVYLTYPGEPAGAPK